MEKNKQLKQYSWITAKIYSLILLFDKNIFVLEYFKETIDKKSEILEIGSGTGKDYKSLSDNYNITGSDYSEAFLNILRKKFKGHEFLKLNVLTMNTAKKFDVIFSNKVLQHLTPEQLKISLAAQYNTLNDGGILFHTIWKGDPETGKYDDLPDIRYRHEDFMELKGKFEIVNYIEYKEFKNDDSFIIILRK